MKLLKKFFQLRYLEKMKNKIFTTILLIFVAWRLVPTFIANLSFDGTKIPGGNYRIISSGPDISDIHFPPKKAIAIFWATWCGPCKLEMQRLGSSVQNGKIKQNQIFAINPFEAKQAVEKFLAENQYPFTFIDAPEVTKTLKVELTPTTVFISDGVVSSMSSGLSLIGIWKAELFLKN